MALIFADSFCHETTAAGGLPRKWTTQSLMASAQVGPTTAMFDTTWSPCLQTAGNSGGYFLKTLPSNYATLTVGTYFRTGVVTNAGIILALGDAGTLQVEVRYTATGAITVTRNATVLATSTNVLAVNTPYHIEFKATINNTTGAYEVRVNGTSTNWIPAATGANTRNTANNYANEVRIYSRSSNDAASTNHRFAHFYVLDTSGSVANSFIGPVILPPRYPSAAGNHTDWTGNYASNFYNAGEVLGDSDGTFNQTSTTTNKDSFVMQATPSGTVYGVQASVLVRQDAGSGHTVRMFLRISGTNYYGSAQTVTATHQYLTECWTLNPATSAQWVTADLASIEAGYELVS